MSKKMFQTIKGNAELEALAATLTAIKRKKAEEEAERRLAETKGQIEYIEAHKAF